MKKIAVGNLGEEELSQLKHITLTRDDTRAEADLLFGAPAKDMRKTDRSLLEKLFIQTPASVTMAPNLQKAASAPYSFMKAAYEIKPEDRPDIAKKDFAQPNKEEAGHKGKYPIPDRQHAKSALGFAKMHGDSAAYAAVRAKVKAKFPDMLTDEKEKKSSLDMLKLASTLTCGPDGEDSWLKQFEGTELLPQAIQIEEQSIDLKREEIENRRAESVRSLQQDQASREHWAKNDEIQLQRRTLALELAKHEAGIGAGHPEEEQGEVEEPAGPAQQHQDGAGAPVEMAKTSSITPRVDAFFEKLAAPTEAQCRYPELLKVASSDTKKSLNLKPRVTTDVSGQTPVRSSLAGGSA